MLPHESLQCIGSFGIPVLKVGRGSVMYQLHNTVETAIKEGREEGLIKVMDVGEVQITLNKIHCLPWLESTCMGSPPLSLCPGWSCFPFAYCRTALPVPHTEFVLA